MQKIKQSLDEIYIPTVLHKPCEMSVEQWREENGIPDWANNSAYPKALGRDKIKWEFLRRNYYYKILYSEFLDEDGEFHSKRPCAADEDEGDVGTISESQLAAIEYELPDLIDPKTEAINLGSSIFARHFRGARVHGFHENGASLCVGNAQHDTTCLIEDNRFAIYVFDLRYGLMHQVNQRLLPQLKKLQVKYENDSGAKAVSYDGKTKDYIKHLQVLDAYSERAHPVEIGRIVFSQNKDDKKARDRANSEFKRAMEMWKFF